MNKSLNVNKSEKPLNPKEIKLIANEDMEHPLFSCRYNGN